MWPADDNNKLLIETAPACCQFLPACDRRCGWKKETSKTVRVDFSGRTIASFFPNPATNEPIVTSGDNRAKLQIIDMAGNVFKTEILVNPVEKIAFQLLVRGTNLVRVIDNENTTTEKLAIQ